MTDGREELSAIRRVVVGDPGTGSSRVVFDGLSADVAASPIYDGVSGAVFWKEPASAEAATVQDNAVALRDVYLPSRGTRFSAFSVAPGTETAMHTNPTTDYHVAVSGSIVCVLDSGEFELSAGDTLVVRQASHAWRNDGVVAYVGAVVMVDTNEARALSEGWTPS